MALWNTWLALGLLAWARSEEETISAPK